MNLVNKILSKLLIIISDLSNSLTVALLIWVTWAICSQSLICLEQSEQVAHSRSFDLSDLSKWAMSKWANSQPCSLHTVYHSLPISLTLQQLCLPYLTYLTPYLSHSLPYLSLPSPALSPSSLVPIYLSPSLHTSPPPIHTSSPPPLHTLPYYLLLFSFQTRLRLIENMLRGMRGERMEGGWLEFIW